MRQREKAIAKLAETLRGPQPPPKTLKRPKFRPSPLDVGDVVHVRNEEAEALFVVVGLIRTGPGCSPVVAELLWEGGDIPDAAALKSMPLIHGDPSDALAAIVREVTGTQYEGPVPQLWCVDCPTRGQRALKHHGTVIATGIVGRDAGDLARLQRDAYEGYPSMSGSTWDRISRSHDLAFHDRMVEVTRRVYGL